MGDIGDLSYFNTTEIESIGKYWKLMKRNPLILDEFLRSLLSKLLDDNPHIKPLWPFGRTNNIEKPVVKSSGFRNYVVNLEKSFNILIKCVNNERTLKYMAGDLGSRHFYYGVTESHVDLFGDALTWALRNINQTNGNAFDQEMENVWTKLFEIVKVAMQAGIAKQRLHYLKNSISFHNYSILIVHWDKVKNFGLLEAGSILYEKFINAYRSMIDEYQMHTVQTLSNTINTNDETLKQFIFDTMNTVEGLLIHGYDAMEGFTRGFNATLQYTQAYYISQTWPIFIKRALSQAMPEMLARVLEPRDIAIERNLFLWEKLYRVLEQCVIINILEL